MPLVEAETWDLQDGVAWCAPKSVAWIRGIKDKARRGLDPGVQPDLVTAWLSLTVGYLAEDGKFNVEDTLAAAAAKKDGLTYKITRAAWGPHPVLAYTVTDEDGNQQRAAWVAIGSGTWAVELNCNLPGAAADRFFWNLIENSGVSER